MSVSTKAIRAGLYSKITGASSVTDLLSTTTAVYHGIAPSDARFPLVVINKQAGTPTYTFGDTYFDTQVWLIKAVTRGSTSNTAEDIQSALDALLTDTVALSSGTVLDIRRDSDVDYIEDDDGETYRHHGALYRIRATD